ncbi:hypothetical protein KJ891_01605 [Candidatus Micrarchaeota archaeon]|nr:hypothetical protein [Candidatus Micrarchaeota archaeon]
MAKTGEKTFQELKGFEAQQIRVLEKAKKRLDKASTGTGSAADEKKVKLREEFAKKKAGMIKESEAKANTEAENVVKEYQENSAGLKGEFKKNREKAVKAVVQGLFGE